MKTKMDGNYHIVLKPGASEADFIKHIQTQPVKSLFSTRITTAIDDRLFKVDDRLFKGTELGDEIQQEDETGGFSAHYVLQIHVDLMQEDPLHFHKRTDEINGLVEAFGVATGVDALTLVERPPASS